MICGQGAPVCNHWRGPSLALYSSEESGRNKIAKRLEETHKVKQRIYFVKHKNPTIRVAVQFERIRRINGGALLNDRHPEIPSMRARRLQRPNRVEGPFVFGGKTQGLSGLVAR